MDWNVRFIFSGWIWDNLFDSSLHLLWTLAILIFDFFAEPERKRQQDPRNRNLNRFFSESPSGVDVVFCVMGEKYRKKTEFPYFSPLSWPEPETGKQRQLRTDEKVGSQCGNDWKERVPGSIKDICLLRSSNLSSNLFLFINFKRFSCWKCLPNED